MKTLSKLGCIAILIVASSDNGYGSGRTPTGFYYPTGRALKSGDTSWLASDGDYFIGQCHIGHDFMANLNDPVYPISDGEVVAISLNGWGDNNVGFLIKHKLATGIESMALYGHIQANNLKVTDKVFAEVPIGKVGYWSFGNHLHFGILPSLAYPSGTWGTMPSPGQPPYNGFVDPMNWITTKTPKAYTVGHYYYDGSDGFHADGTSQAFIEAFNRHTPKIGWPVNSVHKWIGSEQKNWVWIQDFQGDMSAGHFGTDGQSAIMLSDYLATPKAYLIKEGFWGYYKENNGQYEFGAPFTEEITTNYADSPFNLPADPVKAGDTITVQKFYRVYGSQRRTLVYNSKCGVLHFPVGEFSIGTDFGLEGEQVYVYVDGPPSEDKPWPNNTRKIPTGEWFTKPGYYTFVRHMNGQRVGALSVHISEGNHQFVGGSTIPANLTAIAETANSIKLTFSLPAGLAGYNIRIYQSNQKVADLSATESYLVSGLSPNTYYCFRVSAVDNASGVESELSQEACATTLSGSGQGYEFDHLTLCLGFDTNNNNNPIGETAVFYNHNQLICAWFKVNNVYGVHSFKWRWYDPSGNLARSESLNSPNPASQGNQYWQCLVAHGWLSIASVNNYGTWQAKIYIDDNLMAVKNFTLMSTVSFNRTTTCKIINSSGNPAGETNVYFNSDNQVCSWVELNHAYGVHQIRWQWLNPDGNLVSENTDNTSRLGDQTYQTWCSFDIAGQSNYGIWRVRVNVDNNLTVTDSFSLMASKEKPNIGFCQMVTCRDVVTNRPPIGILGIPVDETAVFYNSNNYVYSWIMFSNVFEENKIAWRWFDPDGNSAGASTQNLLGPFQGLCWAWCRLDIATNANYGIWQVGTYVDDSLVAERTFALAPPPIAVKFQIAQTGTGDLLVTINGLANSSYTVQTATNIMGPWADYITVYGQTNGVGAFTAPDIPPTRFFR